MQGQGQGRQAGQWAGPGDERGYPPKARGGAIPRFPPPSQVRPNSTPDSKRKCLLPIPLVAGARLGYNIFVSPRHTVTAEVSSRYRPRSKTWAYGLDDLADLLGTTEVALRAKLRRGTLGFDPGDLLVVARLIVQAKDGPRTVVIQPGHKESLGHVLAEMPMVPVFKTRGSR